MKLVNDALNTPPPPYSQHMEGQGENMLRSAQINTKSELNNSMMNGRGSSAYTTSDTDNDNVWDPANFNRRKLFNKCTLSMQGMLVSLDEKNHVISTAAEALAKQLARIDECFPFIDLEISEEARNGSKTHWAYPENRVSRSNSGGPSVKEQSATNQPHTAVQIPGEDSTSKSDSRKQSLVDKRKSRDQQTDSDMIDQSESKQKEKKSNNNSKARKANDTSVGIAVGLTHSSTPNNSSSKRRKVERVSINGANTERLTNSSYVNGVTAGKGRPSSPGSTPPQSESSRKRARALPTTSNGLTNRKRQIVTTPATLLSLSASPSIPKNVSETKNIDKKSPPPSNNGRQTNGRCRQNSVQSTIEKKSVSPSKSKSHTHSTLDRKNVPAVAEISRRNFDLSMKRTCSTAGSQDVHETLEKIESRIGSVTNLSSKGNIPIQRESSETDQDTLIELQSSTFTTTKSGRASKPSTPSSSLFPDISRSRGIGTPLEIVNSRRSHKKSAGIGSHMATKQSTDMDDAEKKRNDENEDVDLDADEPRYCLCNNVSYGEMVACDSKGCKREWFHLACVGLKTAPKGDATWYCEDCKEATKGKRSNNNR